METMYDIMYESFPALSGGQYACSLVVGIFMLVCMWKIFEKAGLEGWKAIIPIYNLYCLYKITWGNGWYFLLTLIPFANVVIAIITLYKLTKAFDKGIGFFFGLWLLNIIFIPILAFGNTVYVGIPDKKNV